MNHRRKIFLGFLLFFWLLVPGPGHQLCAQEREGPSSASLSGAFLGATSGAVLGLLGGTSVCNRSLLGTGCVQVSAALGGTVAGVSGAVLGGRDAHLVDDRWRGAGYGAMAGGLIGLGLSKVARQYGWADVGAFAAVGGAIGASAEGAVIGFGVGAFLGTAGVLAIPEMKIGDAFALSVAGLAVGGLAGWIVSANGAKVEPDRSEPLQIVIPFEVRF